LNAGSHLKYGKLERVREMALEDGEYITNINHYNTGNNINIIIKFFNE